MERLKDNELEEMTSLISQRDHLHDLLAEYTTSWEEEMHDQGQEDLLHDDGKYGTLVSRMTSPRRPPGVEP
eukprot:1827377-Amphidinium_carterae.1